uniref:Elongin A, like n=1 Tax=Mastacembelus armatus TaxID=205130 RepID=A0A7N8YJA3_9TELE
MASSSDVMKKVVRFKLQLTDTVLKILQKLKDLDITLDILAETGIGKTVNSLRRHEQAGELAKSLVRGWKKLVPKDDKYSKMLKLTNDSDKSSSGILSSSEIQNRQRKKAGKERHVRHIHKLESEPVEHSKHKNKKDTIKHKDRYGDSDQEEPSMSFESYLNYDMNVFKRKEQCRVKKPFKKINTVVKEKATKDPCTKPVESPVISLNFTSPQTKESDYCDMSEESAVFTGQRLNRKMQVYSGAKTIFLPTMMSLYQQCIRTLQNNINCDGLDLYLSTRISSQCFMKLVESRLRSLSRCWRDHLWGKHCQRDFKDSKLQEYESWKEMYIRLSEERERKLQRLTKSIVSAHSKKPKGVFCLPNICNRKLRKTDRSQVVMSPAGPAAPLQGQAIHKTLAKKQVR